MRTYSNPDDLVLDNTFGSGSFLLSAFLEGRKYCGIEQNKETHLFKKKSIDYIEVASDRLIRHGATPKVMR